MQKYTVKELTQIEGDHDTLHCEVPGCPICKAFYDYAMKLRTQTEIMERVGSGQTVSAISSNLCVSDAYVQETVAACTGSTISAYQIKGYQDLLNALVRQGLSIPAIARHMRKPISTINQYFRAHDLMAPDSIKFTLEQITGPDGEVRYFDRQGREYQLEKIRQKRLNKESLDLMAVVN